MGRRTLHILMAIAFLACCVSLIHTSLSHDERCSFCGQPMVPKRAFHLQEADGSVRRTLEEHHCASCDSDVILNAD